MWTRGGRERGRGKTAQHPAALVLRAVTRERQITGEDIGKVKRGEGGERGTANDDKEKGTVPDGGDGVKKRTGTDEKRAARRREGKRGESRDASEFGRYDA